MSKSGKTKSTNNWPSVKAFLKKKKNDFMQDKIENQIQKAQSICNEPNHESVVEKSDEKKLNVDTIEDDYKAKANAAEKQLKHAKKLLKQSSSLILEKDIIIKQLMEKNNDTHLKPNSTLFSKYAQSFETDELKTIRSSKPGTRNDSNFILSIMRGLYKGDEIKKLKNRTATGRKYKGQQKHEISFEKKEIIEGMFTERLTDEEQENGAEIFIRFKKLNDLIRSAIHNIVRGENAQSKRARDETDAIENSSAKRTKLNVNEIQSNQVNILDKIKTAKKGY